MKVYNCRNKIYLLFILNFLLQSVYPQAIYKDEKKVYKLENTSIFFSDINYIKEKDSSAGKTNFFNIPELLNSGFTCEATIEILKGNFKADSGYVLYKMNNIKIQPIGNSSILKSLNEIAKELLFPFSAHYSNYGKLISWSHHKGISEMTIRFISNFLSNVLFIRQEDALSNWDMQEQNTSGSYTAHYFPQKNEVVNTKSFIKTKSNFVYTAREGIDHKYDITSVTNFTFNDKGVLDSSILSETIITRNNNDTINASATKLTLKLIPTQTSYIVSLNILDELEKNGITKNSLVNYKSKDDINRLIYKVTLGNNNVDSLMELLKNPLSKEERKNIIAKLRALFYLYPESCKEILNKNRLLVRKEEKMPLIIQALINCRKPYCTDPLVDYLRENKNDKELVFKTLPIVSLTELPTNNLLDFVSELLIDSNYRTPYLNNTLKLAYCNIFKNFRKTDTLFSKKMLPMVTGLVEGANDVLFKIRLMGNTADYLYYDPLVSYALDTAFSEEVRLAALGELIQFDRTYSVRIEKQLSSILHDKNENIINAAKKIIDERNK